MKCSFCCICSVLACLSEASTMVFFLASSASLRLHSLSACSAARLALSASLAACSSWALSCCPLSLAVSNSFSILILSYINIKHAKSSTLSVTSSTLSVMSSTLCTLWAWYCMIRWPIHLPKLLWEMGNTHFIHEYQTTCLYKEKRSNLSQQEISLPAPPHKLFLSQL